MQRRHLMGALSGAAASALSVPAAQAAEAGKRMIEFSPVKAGTDLGKKIPINKQRAYEVMAELKIDGLIALRPHNVYYISNTVTNLTNFLAEYPGFATFPRDPNQPSFLLTTIGNSMETSNGDREVPPVIVMGQAKNWDEYVGATPEKMRIEPVSSGKSRSGVQTNADATLTPREQAWRKAQQTYLPDSPATQAWALAKALKDSGLAKGRIAVDDMRIAYLLQSIGFDGPTFIPGDNVFRRIRVIKTEHEVALMRVAQRITQEAMTVTAHALEEGMTNVDFRQRFFAETVARGGETGFILLGLSQAGLPDGGAKRGRTYQMDGSSHFKQYFGDFARTVSIGEPPAAQMKRFKAQQSGRDAAFAAIKAGVPFKRIEQIAREVMIKEGMPAAMAGPSLHSVGLQHGDDPGRMDVPFEAPVDHMLEENMTVTLDLPYTEIGGACGHNEDLLRITKTGFGILNDPKEPLIVV